MPVATAADDSQRFDLKTCPGGYVVVTSMTYGQKLKRQSFTSSAKISAQKGQKDFSAEMELMNEAVQLYEFAHCITEHNLTDKNERGLNFKNPVDVRSLNGRIGEEISTYIGKLNNFEEDDEEGNSTGASAQE